jgi:hypothetical protein
VVKSQIAATIKAAICFQRVVLKAAFTSLKMHLQVQAQALAEV